VVAVFLPVLVWPATLLMSQRAAASQQERMEETVYHWAVSGPEAESLRALVAKAEAAGPGEGEPAFGLEEVVPAPADYRAAIDDGSLHAFIEALPAGTLTTAADPTQRKRRDAEADEEEMTEDEAAAKEPPSPSPVPLYRLHYREDRYLSREGAARLGRALRRANELRREGLLLDRGFPARPSELGTIETKDLASKSQSTGLALGRFISALLVSLLLAGGSVVASDTLAGEKERGTLETLLTTAVSRVEIVIAKQLSILIMALGMTALQLAAIWFYIGSGLIGRS
jgi:hypothetical protein